MNMFIEQLHIFYFIWIGMNVENVVEEFIIHLKNWWCMMTEHEIQKLIQVALSQHKCSVFRTNVGKVQTIDHRWFDTGLPQGFPDLMGYRWVDNQIFMIEVKTKTGKPRKDQLRFHEFLQSHNVIHGIARSVQDALMIVDGGLVSYGYE